MASLEGFLDFAELDAGDKPELNRICFGAAKRYFENAGVPEREGDELYDIGIYQLATHFRDHREVMADPQAAIPPGIFSVVNSLKWKKVDK